jgi:phage-related protein
VVDKPLLWLGSSRSDVRAFPQDARIVAGFQLRRVQQGLDPNDWKPMPTVGPGVREIRIHIEVEHRVFYVASFPEAVYVLHAFEKKTRRTAAQDVELGRKRYRDLMNMRRERGTKERS